MEHGRGAHAGPDIRWARSQITEPAVIGKIELGLERAVDLVDELDPAQGWLFVYVLNVPGVRLLSQLLPLFVADDHSVSIQTCEALIRRATPRS